MRSSASLKGIVIIEYLKRNGDGHKVIHGKTLLVGL